MGRFCTTSYFSRFGAESLQWLVMGASTLLISYSKLSSLEHIKRLSWSASHILSNELKYITAMIFSKIFALMMMSSPSLVWCHAMTSLDPHPGSSKYSRLQAFLYFFFIKWAQHLMFLATGGPGHILIWIQHSGYKMIRNYHDSRLLHVSFLLRFHFQIEGQQSQRQ